MKDDSGEALEAFNRVARRMRDLSRPSLAAAADAITEALRRACKGIPDALTIGQTGPERWSWFLPGSREVSLAESAREECQGHPLLTIREEVYGPFDNQLVTSSLILGSTSEQIVTSVLTLLLNHTAAAAGMLAAAQFSGDPGRDTLSVIDRIRAIAAEGDGGFQEAFDSIVKKDSGVN